MNDTNNKAPEYSKNNLLEHKIFSISELNNLVSNLLNTNVPLLWISGEISNFKQAYSGHWYFTLKDDRSQVRAVMFKGRSQYVTFLPKDGDHIEVHANTTIYPARGDFQLIVNSMRHAGMGNLYEDFLRLKDLLEREGLFSQSKKISIPKFAQTIGIITSPQAAALHDILTTLNRRSPYAQCIIYPTPVQGAAAVTSIIQAIENADRRKECDVLLLCRGGGTIEDLWCFNDERVARAIASCDLPIISGIGHETDFTIADFIADVRAPTPTAAAELATDSLINWRSSLHSRYTELHLAIQNYLHSLMQFNDSLARRLITPKTIATNLHIKLNSLINRQIRIGNHIATKSHAQLTQLKTRLSLESPSAERQRALFQTLTKDLAQIINQILEKQRQKLRSAQTQLSMLNPHRTLERGYAIVSDSKHKILRSPISLVQGQQINIKLAKGEADINIATVNNIQPKNNTSES